MIRVKIAAIGFGLAATSAKRNFSESEWEKFSTNGKRSLIKRESDRLYDIAKKAASLALKNELAPAVGAAEAGKTTNPTCNGDLRCKV